MTEMDNEVIASLKSTYGENWRRGLIVHILIGLGRSLIDRSHDHKVLPRTKSALFNGDADKDNAALNELEENPLEYVRTVNEKLATQMETLLYTIRRDSLETNPRTTIPVHGELMEAIGVEALLRLKENTDSDLADLIESVVGVAWEEAPLAVRQNTLRMVRLLGVFSTTVCE